MTRKQAEDVLGCGVGGGGGGGWGTGGKDNRPKGKR